MALRNMRIWRYIDEVARVGSVRQAAERLSVTPSALLRRIQDVEYDLSAPIFERHATGVKLTAAGEVLIRWIRSQNADLRRVYSQIEELSGLKRGEIRIACSQAVARSFLLNEIIAFHAQHPMVKFKVTVTDHTTAIQSLANYETDLVLVFRPSRSAELQTILTVGQGLAAIMAADHPLAARETVRIRECAAYDVALPEGSFGGREILEDRLAASSAKLNIVLEANSFDMLADFVANTQAITFQIDIGALNWKSDPRFAVRSVSDLDSAYGPLVLGQFKGRALPLAPAKFAEQLARKLDGLRSLPAPEHHDLP
ncbi:LysR family transcriptional regulator [Flavisphingomonas formosensis]|uniref:LysR family transcriptional regulator n=1 Tax=Flavisphingomonas formosensis TaxID=861534 RepID=UPI0012F8DA8D|nr:LysR family transcriptional regulator [Sphingomonas formosensis]